MDAGDIQLLAMKDQLWAHLRKAKNDIRRVIDGEDKRETDEAIIQLCLRVVLGELISREVLDE